MKHIDVIEMRAEAVKILAEDPKTESWQMAQAVSEFNKVVNYDSVLHMVRAIRIARENIRYRVRYDEMAKAALEYMDKELGEENENAG